MTLVTLILLLPATTAVSLRDDCCLELSTDAAEHLLPLLLEVVSDDAIGTTAFDFDVVVTLAAVVAIAVVIVDFLFSES